MTEAKTVINNMLTAFKNLDFKKAQKYIAIKELATTDERTSLVIKTIFRNFSYEIISANAVDDKNVSIKAKITSTNIKPVIGEIMKKTLEYAFSNFFVYPHPTDKETDEKTKNIIIECVSKPNLATVTKEVDIKVIKKSGNKWKINADDALINALLGGLAEAVQGIGNAFTAGE